MQQKTKVFLCFSSTDQRIVDRLRVHLAPLERSGRIHAWDTGNVEAGEHRRAAVERSLAEAGVAVLLVSADWAASDFIQDVELPLLLSRARAEGVPILPLLVGPCQMDLLPLSGLKFVNDVSRPLRGLPEPEQEVLLKQTAEALRRALGMPVAQEEVDPMAARNELTQILTERFRQAERQNLLHRLGIDPDDVKMRPEDREEFARAMVVHLDNRGVLDQLWDEVCRQRPALLRGRYNPFRS